MMMYQRAGGAGVLHQITNDVNAVVARRFITERRRRAGQGQVIVNRLGHMRDADFAVALLGHDAGGKGRVVTADRHERGDAKFVKDAEDVLHLRLGLGGVRARGAENRAAAQMDVLHIADGQRPVVLHIALRQPFETILKADDFVALIDAFNGGCGDDAVEARCRAATNQNS